MELRSPTTPDGHWSAGDRHGDVEVRFVGRGPYTADRSRALAAVAGDAVELAWCRQIHSAQSVEAHPGECGEADALFTNRPGLALAVATADCVPVIVAASGGLGAIHAGWRGIAAGIVPKTLERLGATRSAVAWLGPAIGPCCYEVGSEVAEAVVAASGEDALVAGATPKPHLDLHRAVVLQLEGAGIGDIRRVQACTFCRRESLSSYRRQGAGAGRNWTFAWLGA